MWIASVGDVIKKAHTRKDLWPAVRGTKALHSYRAPDFLSTEHKWRGYVHTSDHLEFETFILNFLIFKFIDY